MKEKTKKILKGVGLGLGSIAILALGVGIGACSVKNGSTQPITTTPIRKGLKQTPKNASIPSGEVYQVNIGASSDFSTSLPRGEFLVSWSISLTNEAQTYTMEAEVVDFIPEDLTIRPTGGDDYLEIYPENGSIKAFAVLDDEEHIFNASSVDITFNTATDLGNYESWFLAFMKAVEPEPEPEPEPIPLPEVKEKVVLNASYDFRRWFGNVDPTTGLIQYSLGSGVTLVNIRIGGLEWVNLGNNRLYNVVEFTLQPLQADNAFLVSDNLAKTASSLYGDNRGQFAMLSNVYYAYQSDYDGSYSVLPDTQLPNVDYRDQIYKMPLVTAQLDGTNNNINAIDVRNCVIPSIYRTFGISEDSEIVFSTNGYSSVTLRQLLGMDFSSVVNYSDGTASAFSLLTQAFGSVAGLLAVQVLPNITLGLLIFLPLIASVIVLIIKAVKK